MRTYITAIFLFLFNLSYCQTTDIRYNSGEVSIYQGYDLIKRFNLPYGSVFIGWNSECVLLIVGSDFRTMDHDGNFLSSLNIGYRKFIQITQYEIIIKEDSNQNYYNSNFKSLRKLPIR